MTIWKGQEKKMYLAETKVARPREPNTEKDSPLISREIHATSAYALDPNWKRLRGHFPAVPDVGRLYRLMWGK